MNKSKILLIIPIVFAIIVVVSVLFLRRDSNSLPPEQQVTTGTGDPLLFDPSEDTINDPKLAIFDELVVGESTSEDIRRIPGIKSEKTISNGIEFHFSSSLIDRDNLAVTENNILIYKRFIALKDVAQWESPSLITYLERYGEPEFKKKGSVFFGSFATLFVWATKGIAIVGNDFTDEVFEVHVFKESSVDNYLTNWGQDSTEYIEETPEDHSEEVAL